MHLEIASRATALTDAAGSLPDSPTEPLPVPASPIPAVEALPPISLSIGQRPVFRQTTAPEPDAKPHREHVHGVQIGDRLPILDRPGYPRRRSVRRRRAGSSSRAATARVFVGGCFAQTHSGQGLYAHMFVVQGCHGPNGPSGFEGSRVFR